MAILLLAVSLSNQESQGSSRADEVADPETSTPHGCTCTSLCGPTVEDGFTLDWCYTGDECGEYSNIYGYWDYCEYLAASQPDWLAMDWKVKQDMIWSEVKADATYGSYHPDQIFTESFMTTFENQWDVLPAGRVKVIHGIGAVCPFTIDIVPDSPYTGVLKAGTQNGLLRMGGGGDWRSILTPGLLPGTAVKFLRTGAPSANVVLVNSQVAMPDSYDFFAVPLRNHVPDISTPAIELFAKKACSTGHCITKVGLSNFATYDQEGTNYPDPVFPFKIGFEPADVHFQVEQPESMEAFMAQFEAIEVGTTVYTMRAYASPDDSEGTVLGNIVTADKCVASNYGDTRLAFRHQWIEDDVALRPDWSDG